MNFTPIIGLEIHIQGSGKSKMFTSGSAEYFDTKPNSKIDEVTFGLPGSLPVPNKDAISQCIKLALSLNCKIAEYTNFDRKHYYYPDLPKGYQISQFDKPIGSDGFLEIFLGNGSTKQIQIKRIHIEEDTAKSMHAGDKSLIDYNKSGIILFEIVTEPVFESVEEVAQFAKQLRQHVRYLGVSDAEMQKGQMRFELNMSMQSDEEKQKSTLPKYKVEVKNIGSISVLEKVIKSEIERQTEILQNGGSITQHTRGLVDMSGATKFQRSKETADDYRYFPEPDIPPFLISDEFINKIRNNTGITPNQKRTKYMSLDLQYEIIETFVEFPERGEYFDKILTSLPKEYTENEIVKIANWINSDIAGLIVKLNLEFETCKITGEDFVGILENLAANKINSNHVKSIFENLIAGKDLDSIISNVISNSEGLNLDSIVDEIIANNPKVVADIAKNPNAIQSLLGQVMRQSKGTFAPADVLEKLKSKLLA